MNDGDQRHAILTAYNHHKKTLWVFDRLSTAQRICREVSEFYRSRGVLHRFRKTDLVIEFPAGGWVWFATLEPVTKFQGCEFHFVDQHSSMEKVNPDSWGMLMTRVRS